MYDLDLLIENGTILTMNPRNDIITKGAIAVKNGIIVDIGAHGELGAKYNPDRVIDASNSVILPGLIDTYAHAGHAMIKGIWNPFKGWPSSDLYFNASTEEFWYADGLLAAVDRLKSGTTTGVSIIGATPARLDSPAWADNNAKAVKEVGIRAVIGVGPPDPFLPGQNRLESTIWADGKPSKHIYTYDETIENSKKVIEKWHMEADGRIYVCLSFPYLCGRLPSHSKHDATYNYRDEDIPVLLEKAMEMRRLADKYGVQIHTHLYGDALEFGLEKFGKENIFKLFGPDVVLAHCNGLTAKEIEIISQTDTKIATAPSATEPTRHGRCPVPDLIKSGVCVATSTDGAAPHMSYDLFLSMRNEILIQRYHEQNPSYLPAGKALRMVTIDAARVLGLEKEIGSIEVGKQADIILINSNRPHYTPLRDIPQLLVYFGSGHDVTTAMVRGKILMENRIVKTVDESEVVRFARAEIELAFQRFESLGYSLDKYLNSGDNFWTGYKLIDDGSP